MTTTSVINHLNIELYPAGTHKHWAGKWFIGATHHSLHHSQYLFNYGLYFTFWDKIMHTESDKYAPLFEEKTK
jgi:sterol desaturase/sphingolipid hydroxylase (fatty acid hydroxylase superfamily)